MSKAKRALIAIDLGFILGPRVHTLTHWDKKADIWLASAEGDGVWKFIAVSDGHVEELTGAEARRYLQLGQGESDASQ